jgi:hypothetical protein
VLAWLLAKIFFEKNERESVCFFGEKEHPQEGLLS